MTAQITGFVTRADAGLRAPRSFSRNITPEKGGVALHYGGPAQKAAQPEADHALCVKTWRDWQNYHMNTHGWADIAYTGGYCNHGYAFAGRGAGVRTAANGTNFGNQNYYAITWIGGENQSPTDEALDALQWWVNELRDGGAAKSVRTHRSFKSTGCPGNPLVFYCTLLDNIDVELAAPEPEVAVAAALPSGVDRELTKRIQELLQSGADGFWGADTDLRADLMVNVSRARAGWPANISSVHYVQGAQSIVGVVPDGVWGPKSQAALHDWIGRLQGRLSMASDGLWGPQTDSKFNEVRLANRGQF